VRPSELFSVLAFLVAFAWLMLANVGLILWAFTGYWDSFLNHLLIGLGIFMMELFAIGLLLVVIEKRPAEEAARRKAQEYGYD
jgi:hypothetical protein